MFLRIPQDYIYIYVYQVLKARLLGRWADIVPHIFCGKAIIVLHAHLVMQTFKLAKAFVGHGIQLC